MGTAKTSKGAKKTPAKAQNKTPRKTSRKTPAKTARTGRTCILLTSMHRSGTSMLTGILDKLGLTPGETLMPANFANEAGYYESLPVASLNDEILLAAGSSWDDWHPIDPDWFASPACKGFYDRAQSVLAQEYGEAPLFVLKDPRICRLLPFWRKVFEAQDIRVVTLHITRSPANVAASLNHRDGMGWDYAHLLWLRNVLEAEAATRDLPRFFTTYSTVVEDWQAVISAMARVLEFDWPHAPADAGDAVQGFINPDLIHFAETPDTVQDQTPFQALANDIYALLVGWARHGPDPKDHTRLTKAQTALGDMTAPMAEILDASLAELKRRQARDDMLTRLRQQLEREVTRAAYWKDKTQARTEEAEQLQLDITTTRVTTDRKLDRLRTRLAKAEATHKAQAEAQAQTLSETLERLRKDHDLALQTLRSRIRTEAQGAKASTVLSEENAALKGALAEAEQAISLLQGSTSWRVTAPLRRVKKLFDG